MNKILIYTTTWMNLKTMVLSKGRPDTKQNVLHTSNYIYLEFQKSETDLQTQRRVSGCLSPGAGSLARRDIRASSR